jgi:hypothetical protein
MPRRLRCSPSTFIIACCSISRSRKGTTGIEPVTRSPRTPLEPIPHRGGHRHGPGLPTRAARLECPSAASEETNDLLTGHRGGRSRPGSRHLKFNRRTCAVICLTTSWSWCGGKNPSCLYITAVPAAPADGAPRWSWPAPTPTYQPTGENLRQFASRRRSRPAWIRSPLDPRHRPPPTTPPRAQRTIPTTQRSPSHSRGLATTRTRRRLPAYLGATRPGEAEIRQTPFSVNAAVFCARRVCNHLPIAMGTRTC